MKYCKKVIWVCIIASALSLFHLMGGSATVEYFAVNYALQYGLMSVVPPSVPAHLTGRVKWTGGIDGGCWWEIDSFSPDSIAFVFYFTNGDRWHKGLFVPERPVAAYAISEISEAIFDGKYAHITMGGRALIYRMALPEDDEVETVYRAANPAREIKSILPGEGDSNAVYYHIRYEDPVTSSAGEDVWLFEWKGDEWVGISRNSVREESKPVLPGGRDRLKR